MTTATTDAEAIARIIEDRPFEEDYQKGSAGAFNARGRKEAALRKAECILSYLASRREAQEPVDWIYEDELPSSYPYGRMFAYSKVRDGVRMFPVYAPPAPAPAGEVERLREALGNVKAAILRADPEILTDTLWMPDDLSRGETVVDHIDAALNGGRE